MTALFIDRFLYALFLFVLGAVPVVIVSVVVCVILDVHIKNEENNNFLGRGKK